MRKISLFFIFLPRHGGMGRVKSLFALSSLRNKERPSCYILANSIGSIFFTFLRNKDTQNGGENDSFRMSTIFQICLSVSFHFFGLWVLEKETEQSRLGFMVSLSQAQKSWTMKFCVAVGCLSPIDTPIYQTELTAPLGFY